MRKRVSFLSKKSYVQPVVDEFILTLCQLRTQSREIHWVSYVSLHSPSLDPPAVGVTEVVSTPASFVFVGHFLLPKGSSALCSWMQFIPVHVLEWQIWAKNQSQSLWWFYLGVKNNNINTYFVTRSKDFLRYWNKEPQAQLWSQTWSVKDPGVPKYWSWFWVHSVFSLLKWNKKREGVLIKLAIGHFTRRCQKYQRGPK